MNIRSLRSSAEVIKGSLEKWHKEGSVAYKATLYILNNLEDPKEVGGRLIKHLDTSSLRESDPKLFDALSKYIKTKEGL